MLGDRLAGERDPAGQPAGTDLAVADHEVEDPAARRVRVSGGVADVYSVAGTLTALIALSFAFSPVSRGDRYLAEAASAKAASVAMAEAGPGPAEQ